MIKTDIAGRKFAAYEKTNRGHIKLLVSSTLSFAFFIALNWRMESPAFFVLVIFSAGGIARALYYMRLKMPYLFFTEDKFYFDTGNDERSGYWRDVISIHEKQLSPSRYIVYFKLNNDNIFKIDTNEILFESHELIEVAYTFMNEVIADADKVSA